MKRSAQLLTTLLLLALATVTTAHFNFKHPFPYNRISCKSTEPWCQNACPPIWRTGGAKARNSPRNPSATWRRGQHVTIEWHKNNHVGGFYRRSLVPVKHMFSPYWHKRTAFEFGCWSQGSFYCGKSPSCGTDKRGIAYRNKMIVPKVVPNGDYVLAMVWYGGFDWLRDRAVFSDFYACSFVRIRGGPLLRSHTPVFNAGRSKRNGIPYGMCGSCSVSVNECGGHPCKKRKPGPLKPVEFQNRRPPTVYRYFFDKNAMKGGRIPYFSFTDERRAINSNKRDKKTDDQMVYANDKKNKFMCRGKGPQKPFGSWGRRYSPWWHHMRKIWVRRRKFCLTCRGREHC